MAKKTDWENELKPLLKKYKGRHHPLEYKNIYQLVVMIVLAAQSTDNIINMIAPDFFKEFPNMKVLSAAKSDQLYPFISKVRNFKNKANWLVEIARAIKTDKNIPATMEELVKLPGIGRKTSNVIMHESGVAAEGVIVDLHVVRVAPRLGIATGDDPQKIEKQIMDAIPKKIWGETGMAISFLGREICRPTNPNHGECVLNNVCKYYLASKKKS